MGIWEEQRKFLSFMCNILHVSFNADDLSEHGSFQLLEINNRIGPLQSLCLPDLGL